MLKDFDAALKEISGENAIDGNGSVVTMKVVIVNALFSGDENASGDDKAHRYILGMRINNGGVQELSIEDAVLIKKLIGNHPMPLVVGQVYEFLN
jgi:hypothetical protein